MRTRTFIALAFGTLGMSLTGCNASGKSDAYKPKPEEKVTPITIVPGQESDLFPVKVGNTWVYEDESTSVTGQGTQTGTSEVTFRVTKVADTPDGKEATVEVSSNGKLSDRIKWRVGPSGITQISGSDRTNPKVGMVEVKYEPPLPVVPFPVAPGHDVNVTSVGMRPGAGAGPFKATIAIDGIQEVDTAMGRFSALSTTSVTKYQDKSYKFQSTATMWWTPKIGIVRYYQEILVTNAENKTISSTSKLRLKSHQP